MFVFLLFLSLFFVVWGVLFLGGIVEVSLDRCGTVFSDAVLMLDGVSLICLLMLVFCGMAALLFCGHYFGFGSLSSRSLYRVLVLFLSVMGLLVVSSSLLGSLVMWEYLGVVSFFLILYYSNLESMRATLVTLFASRFGDVCLFGLLCYVSFWGCEGGLFFGVLVLIVVATKSACFPFTSWLLEAMRAPTPVSSLVHSSTLVAAGTWFLFRYGEYLNFSFGLELVFFLLSISTILISSFCSIAFFDLKKIVALSTCNNISWCIIFFLFGDLFLGLFQLLSHGVAKCYLFISLGDLMSCSSSAQDSRGVFCFSHGGFAMLGVQSVLVLSLSGVPFIGIFFSKHGLLSEMVWSYSLVCYLLLFVCFLLSCVYSFRFLVLLSGFGSLSPFSYGSLFLFVSLSSLLSSALSVLCVSGSLELFVVGRSSSGSVIILQALGCVVGLWLRFRGISSSLSLSGLFLWGCEGFVGGFYRSFGSLLGVFSFLLYRWEVLLASSFRSTDWLLGVWGGIEWRSLKFLILSGFVVVSSCFVFC